MFSIVLACIACGGEDDPPPPSAATLVFPEQNSECTTGNDLGNGTSEITFEWQPSDNTLEYILRVVNAETNTVVSSQTTANTSSTLAVAVGTPFSWSITSLNSTEETAESESWLFYNAGTQTNYAPFPAQIISPISGSTVLPNGDGEILLQWSGADVENDIIRYDVYFSSTTVDDLSVVQDNNSTSYTATGVTSPGVYYWKILTFDAQGNSSDSGVFEFKVP